MIPRFRRVINEIFAPLGRYVAQIGCQGTMYGFHLQWSSGPSHVPKHRYLPTNVSCVTSLTSEGLILTLSLLTYISRRFNSKCSYFIFMLKSQKLYFATMTWKETITWMHIFTNKDPARVCAQVTAFRQDRKCYVFGKSLCTYKRCWKWCPRTSIQAWTKSTYCSLSAQRLSERTVVQKCPDLQTAWAHIRHYFSLFKNALKWVFILCLARKVSQRKRRRKYDQVNK
jgi:hypothetical protein